MYIYKISQEHSQIAKVEIEILLKNLKKLNEGLFLVSTYSLEVQKLAYTKKVYKILSKNSDLDVVLSTHIEDEYRFDDTKGNTLILADKLFSLHKKKVSLKNYKHHYVLFFEKDMYYFTELIYENKDTGQNRRAHQRIYNHPTSMHPLLAKAMVNLSGKKSFIDPFCGAGGILIEGALLGYEVLGVDISEEMIERAQKNLDGLGLVAQLTVKDALCIESTYDAIITDLPYGKNSILKSIELYDLFLEHAKKITDILVIGSKKGSITDLHGWNEIHRFSIYVHKSLRREILVLHK